MYKIMNYAIFGILCLLVLLAATTHAQQVLRAPMPPTRYVAWQDQGPSEQEAQAEVGEEDKEGELDFLDKDLREISRTQVTSPALSSDIDTVSRTTQPLARTAAAVYVVTNEMIKRCGARNIPEVLRTVPGVNVARINASTWAITIRGFNGRFANKLLVQIDGVAVYSPINGGVYWEREWVMLEDVDRIEVIRGPGAAVWGANAVNGIINIVTKSSKDTKGSYLDIGGGNEHRQFSNLRVGGQVGRGLTWRVYGMNIDDDHGVAPQPYVAVDGLQVRQGGFRADWSPTCCDTITFQGDFNTGEAHNDAYSFPPFYTPTPADFARTVFLTRWVHETDENTDWALQLYYYNPYMENPGYGQYIENDATFDLDFQYHCKRGRHDFVWGFGYRNNKETFSFNYFIPFYVKDSEQIPSYFVQDTITLVEDRLYATFGSKFDHNSVTHFEYQPAAQVAWTPNERTSIWGSISRAVRTPPLTDRWIYTGLHSENVVSYQAGIRRQPNDKLFWECAAFFSRYEDLFGSDFFELANVGSADTYGFEFNATYEVNSRWHLNGWYALFLEDYRFPSGFYSPTALGSTPRNECYFQSGWDLGQNISLDFMLRYVDSLAIGVDHYTVGDIRLAWRPSKNFEFSVVGQNLFDSGHYEQANLFYSGGVTEVEPGVYGMVSWRH